MTRPLFTVATVAMLLFSFFRGSPVQAQQSYPVAQAQWPAFDSGVSYASATTVATDDIIQPAVFSADEPTLADEDISELTSLHERIDQLEEYINDQKEAKEKEKAKAAGKPSLKVNGRIHLDTWSFADSSPGIGFFEHSDAGDANFGTDPENRIFFRRIRLSFSGEAFDTMLYRLQVDFNTVDSGEMKDMYIGFQELPILGTLLIGNQKRPLGLDHLNSSRYNVFIERPLVVEAFNEDARRTGIASYNYTEDESHAWCYGVYLMENMSRDGKYLGDSTQASFNARLANSPLYEEYCDGLYYFHWAVSGMVAHPDGDVTSADTNGNEGRFRTRSEIRSDSRWLDTGRIAGADWYEVAGVESILNMGPLQIVGEYQSTWMQRDAVTAGTGPDLNFHGGYVYVAYMLTGESIPYDRTSGTIGRVHPDQNFFVVDSCNCGISSGSGAWQVAFRYSYLDLTDNDIAGGVENNATLGLVWYFNPNSSLQFNAVYGDIEDRSAVGGYSDGHFTALGTRLRMNF